MKKLDKSQIQALAEKYDIEYAALMAVLEVESKGSGFNPDGTPIILFEPHIFWSEVGKRNYLTLRSKMQQANPRLIYPKWRTYPYGKISEQHSRLQDAINLVFKVYPNLDPSNINDFKIINDIKEAALCSASWGLGQVMGFHWKLLGFSSVQEFVDNMYTSEEAQLDAMLRFCVANNLIRHLKNKNWSQFAHGYNGSGYARNQYHIKLEASYNKHSKAL